MNKNLCMFIGFLLVGILGTFHEFFLSGFDKMPGTPVDARFINYILEHIYSWVFQIPQHYELFSPPFLYPMKNALFYSDTMLSVAPIYFVFRLFNEAFISYALTVISFFVLNYTAFYFILKHFKFKPLYSCLGALLYAFSLLNNIHIIHAQMLTQFFSLFAILCLLKVSKNNKHNTHLFVLFGLLIPCQFYSGFYLGYFTFVGFLFGLIICLFFKKSRRRIYIFFRRYYKQIITSFGLMVLLLTPLAVAYLSVEEARDFAESVQAMFLFSSFRNSNSILWGHSIDELFRYREVYVSSFGYVTLLVGFFGLFLFNKRFFILTFLIFLCLFQYNGISLVYIFMP
ncbi:hypothetical protein IJV79_02840, partial [bacterium]|nr:hypothetical protein [bacterium]